MIIDYKINKGLHQVRDHLTSEFLCYLSKYGNKITQHKRDLAKKAVSCLVLNVYPRFVNGNTKTYITLHKSHYSKAVIVNGKITKRKVSYKYFRSLLDFLDFEDYITVDKGKVEKYTYRSGYYEILEATATSITARPRLEGLFKEKGDFYPERRGNVMFTKNKKKEFITFNMNIVQKQVKVYIDEYNAFSLKHVVKCRGKVYDTQIYKVYNDSNANKGARSYMSNSIQGLSKQDRLSMTINEQEVCVYDYQGFEPSITYSTCQEVMECVDPYEINLPDFDKSLLRKLTKVGLLIMLNADSKDEAVKAFNYSVAKEYNLTKLWEDGKIPTKYVPTKIILQLLEEKHHLIAHRFYGSHGKEVMYVGSLINDYVCGYMMQNYKVLVVQTHDEFTCDIKYKDELYKAMQEGYEYVTGVPDNCRITREK